MPASSLSKIENPLFVGIDVGGTNIKIGVVDNRGQIVAETKFATQPDKPPMLGFVHAKQELDDLLSESGFEWDDVARVGLGTPGPLDLKTGTTLTPTNLPGWHDTPVRDQLSQVLNKPVTFANDGGAAAFAEFWIGTGKDYDSMVMLTLGTGVGGGIVVGETTLDGANSHGGELGHIMIDSGSDARVCGCGQSGHLEAYASASALVSRTRDAMSAHSGENDSILQNQISDESPLSALMISNAADAGDSLAIKMIDQTAVYLAKGVAQLGHIINPAVFILGGAMNFGGDGSALGQKFLYDVLSAARKLVFPVIGQNLIIRYAKLGSEAGFVGAAGLARAEYLKRKDAH